MNWWNILEIPYDSDLKTIKKTYAKLLKVYNPEDDAEGYQRIREAYDKAVKYAKRNNKSQNTQEIINKNTVKNIINEENIAESYLNEDKQNISGVDYHSDEIYHEEQEAKVNLNEQISEFLNRLNEIYNNMSLRINTTAWEDLLNSDVIWNAYSFPIIEDEIFKFLVNHKNLPTNVWIMLNDNFNWIENERKLYDKYSIDTVDEFLKNIKNPNPLSYDYLVSINSEISPEIQKTKSSNVKGIIRTIIFILILLSAINSAFKHKDRVASIDDKFKTVYNINEENIQDDETFKAIKAGDDLNNVRSFINIKLYVKDIKPLGYYKLLEKFNDKVILSKAEIDNNNLQDKIESQLFMGTFDNGIIIFADNNCNEDTIEKNSEYLLKGGISTLGFKSIKDIKSEYKTKDFYWPKDGCYIDCSQKEIESVKKESKLIEIQGNKVVRVPKTVGDFIGNDYPGLQSLYLTNIMIIDVYASAYINDKFDFLRKDELNQKNLADYTQAFVGKMDGKNIMFIDKNFSANNLDSNKGSTIYGYSYSFAIDDQINLPIEQGQNTDLVTIESNFLYNKVN